MIYHQSTITLKQGPIPPWAASAVVPLEACGIGDCALQANVDTLPGKTFMLALRADGTTGTRTIARTERRLGRKHGRTAQWLVWFEDE